MRQSDGFGAGFSVPRVRSWGFLFLLYALSVGAATLAVDQPKKYRITIAHPIAVPIFAPDDSLFFCTEDEYHPLKLSISKSGEVISVISSNFISNTRLIELTRFFQQARFKPGRRGNDAVAQTVPVTIYLFADRRNPVVAFPIGTTEQVEDAQLYWRALEFNGVSLPRLLKFPSYHSTLSGSDNLLPLRCVLCEIQLDTAGEPSSIELVQTSYQPFAGQVLNAMDWATYQPSRFDSSYVASTCFLHVSFIPGMQYPTRPWIAALPDAGLRLEQLAIRMLPDTLGLLTLPIPRYTSDWSYPLAVKPGLWRNQGVFRYRIDASGRAHFVSGGNGSDKAQQFGKSLSALMRFYPATNTAGVAVEFEGVVLVTPDSESNVRVRFLWLQ